MSERDGYEPGVPCWVDTLQPDPQAALSFYRGLFGWAFERPGPMPGDPPGEYFVARIRGRDVAGVGSSPPGGARPPSVWNTYVYVESADDTAQKAASAGGVVVVEPFDVRPAGRTAVLTDPAGAYFYLWEARDRKGAQIVNEPRAWSLSSLNTRDHEAAKTFYGEVFGWEYDTFQAGQSVTTLCRVPGYVGGEPAQPVPRDVVAVIMLMSGDPGADEAPAHWSVDFWIDDVDASAAKAAELGGKVVVSPFDTPISRDAVLADPQGAVFSVSKLSPAG